MDSQKLGNPLDGMNGFLLRNIIIGSLDFNIDNRNLSCLKYLNAYLRCQLVLN